MAETPEYQSITAGITSSAESKDAVYFGRTDFRGADRLFGIQRKDRRQHMYVIGQTGTGKSSLLHNMILQDVINGEGLCVVDPHGELIEGIIEKIPKSRAADVIYFNPSDVDYPMGFNVLEIPDPRYKHLVASGLMGIFTKIWSSVWSARMEYILNNCVLALLDTPNTTLLGIQRILVDKDYRETIIRNLKDPVVKAFWVTEYDEWQEKYRTEAIAPIQNKVGQFLSTPLVRNVLGQNNSTINFPSILNTRKIFLVNVSKGRIGEDNSALLGAMIITKIQLAAMERVRIPEEERKDFYLYVDEFQNFATDSFANILSEARKYRLDLIIAHQYVGQLMTDTSTKVRDAVFGNVGTMVTFRVGATDAEFLEKEFDPEFLIEDLVNLPNYRIYLKLMINGLRSRPFSAKTLPLFKINSEAAGITAVIDLSRKQYARPRAEVERDISHWSGMETTASAAESVGERVEFAGMGAGAGVVRGEVVLGKDGKTPMYPVSCSNCGKESRVPFKPTAGRPVYCSECLEKIKNGELHVLSPQEIQKLARQKEESVHALSEMGIEFAPERPAPRTPERPRDNRPQFPPRHNAGAAPKAPYPPVAHGGASRNEARPVVAENFISSKNLAPERPVKPAEPIQPVATKVNVDELRELIKDTLSKKDGE